MEECDDGNTASGDGCSTTCLIEPGFTCTSAFPDVCSPLDGPATVAAAAFPLQGLLQVTPLGGCSSSSGSSSDPAFGWASFVAAAPVARTAGLPAVYRLGPPGSNDASGSGGAGCAAAAAGDGFVCPCTGAGGMPPGRVWAEAGTLEEAAGIVPRDGTTCIWTFPYSPIFKVALSLLPEAYECDPSHRLAAASAAAAATAADAAAAPVTVATRLMCAGFAPRLAVLRN